VQRLCSPSSCRRLQVYTYCRHHLLASVQCPAKKEPAFHLNAKVVIFRVGQNMACGFIMVSNTLTPGRNGAVVRARLRLGQADLLQQMA